MESLSIERIAAVLALLACASCGGYQLEGSLSTVLDLHYSRASAATGPDQVVVRFTQPLDSGENVVLQVGAQRVGLDPNTLQFDLAESISQGNQRGVISRNVFNDPRTTFPPLSRGRLQFNAPLAIGKSVSGNFNATFADGTSFASGRTVFGSFGATVTQ